MPEQAALSELVLSPAFKRCQRALSHWLEQQSDAHLSIVGIRKTLYELSQGEWNRLMNWLDCLLYAAQHNHDMMMAARIERLTTSLGRATPSARAEVHPSAAMAMTGKALSHSA